MIRALLAGLLFAAPAYVLLHKRPLQHQLGRS